MFDILRPRGNHRRLLSRTKARLIFTYAFVLFRIATAGCSTTNRTNDSASGSGSPQNQNYLDSGAISPIANGGLDATSSPSDWDVGQDRQVPAQDASTEANDASDSMPSLDASVPKCGVLRPWEPPEGVRSPVTISGADGFAAVDKGSPDSGLYGVSAYGASGSVIRSIYPDGIPRDTMPIGPHWSITKAKADRDMVAVMATASAKAFPTGFKVVVNKNGPLYAAAYGFNALFVRASTGIGLINSYGWDGSLLAIAPDDTLVVGTCGSVHSASETPTNPPMGPSPALGLARLDGFENVIRSMVSPLGSLLSGRCSQLEVDKQNQTLVLISGQSEVDTGQPEYLSRILLFSEDFALIGSWKAPSDVYVSALRLDGDGRIVVVGRRGSEDQANVWLQKLAISGSLSAPVLSEVWPNAQIDGNGEALALDLTPSGEFVVAGYEVVDFSNGVLWLQRYNVSGVPLWSQRVKTSFLRPNWIPYVDVSVQSDGSIFVSVNSNAFVYCATAPWFVKKNHTE